MKMTKEKYNLSYFDVACEKHGFLRNYLQFLPPSKIEIILLICTPHMTKKKVCEELNKNPDKYRDYSSSRLDALLTTIKGKLYTMHAHASLFGITGTIKPVSVTQLERIVEEQK